MLLESTSLELEAGNGEMVELETSFGRICGCLVVKCWDARRFGARKIV